MNPVCPVMNLRMYRGRDYMFIEYDLKKEPHRGSTKWYKQYSKQFIVRT